MMVLAEGPLPTERPGIAQQPRREDDGDELRALVDPRAAGGAPGSCLGRDQRHGAGWLCRPLLGLVNTTISLVNRDVAARTNGAAATFVFPNTEWTWTDDRAPVSNTT